MLKIIKQHKFTIFLTVLLSTFFTNLFPSNSAKHELNTVLQIMAGVNLLQHRHQVFFLILSVIVFRQVIFSARINTESICAALRGFLLIGYMGFFMFPEIENHMPDAFRGPSHDELQMMNELFYYSFISILTVGYSDIVAVSWPARNANILVILTGYIYSLAFIARIVSGFSVSKNHSQHQSLTSQTRQGSTWKTKKSVE